MTAKRASGGKGEAAGGESASFEGAMQRLEALVGEMEGGKLNLEDMIARFEEGQKLIAFCTGKLNEVERKVEMLVKRGERETLEPFPEDEEAPAPPGETADDKDELF